MEKNFIVIDRFGNVQGTEFWIEENVFSKESVSKIGRYQVYKRIEQPTLANDGQGMKQIQFHSFDYQEVINFLRSVIHELSYRL